MSLPVKPGIESSEHWRAWRAEVVGISLVLAGLLLSFTLGWQGVAVCGIGAVLLGWTGASYAASRGDVKAAAVRRPADQAPRR